MTPETNSNYLIYPCGTYQHGLGFLPRVPFSSVIAKKTKNTTGEIFKEDYPNMFVRAKDHPIDELAKHGKIAKPIVCASSCGLIFTGVVAAIFDNFLLSFGFLTPGIIGSAISFFIPDDTVQDFNQLAACEKIANLSNLISDFSNELEIFKLIPQVIKIRELFEKFDQIIDLFKNEKFDGNDFQLFTKTGKFILMDAIIFSLENKENGIINEWEQSLTSYLDSELLWKRFEILEPENQYYDEFLQLREKFNSSQIAEKMVFIFNNALQQS